MGNTPYFLFSGISKMDIEQIAYICHEANRAYCKAIQAPYGHIWEEAPQSQRNSSINGVKAALATPGLSSEEIHDKWMKYKLDEGWTYGEKKDEKLKTHPCIRPYNELPEEERLKDALFLAIVNALRP